MKTDKKPFFSVVLPTLNRAGYLAWAIQSVLRQTFEDFELIVSDNCSTDDTETVVKSFSDARLRPVKTEKTLPMYDSWEFALRQAKGEYVTFLGDDDAQGAIYLESLKKIIDCQEARIVSCRMADYFYQKSGSRQSEFFKTPPFTNKLLIYDSRQLIRDIYVDSGLCRGNPQYKFQLPQLINTAYHRSVFAEIDKKSGRVFPKVLASDFYLAAAALSFTEKYFYLDAPLSFHGISPEGTTASITDEPKGANLKKRQPELAQFKKAPIDVFTPYNFVADALMTAKSDLGDRLGYFELDLTGYFVNIYYELNLSESEGRDVAEERKQFAAALAEQEPGVQREVKSIISNKKNRFKNSVRLKFEKNAVYQFLRDLRHFNRRKNLVVEGKKNGFADIAECAQVVGSNFLNDYKTK